MFGAQGPKPLYTNRDTLEDLEEAEPKQKPEEIGAMRLMGLTACSIRIASY